MKDTFSMATASKDTIKIPTLKESFPNLSDKYSWDGFSSVNLFLSRKRGAY
jgi:hypothetical protein